MPNLTKWRVQPRDPATGKWVKFYKKAPSSVPRSDPTSPRSDQSPLIPPQRLPRSTRG